MAGARRDRYAADELYNGAEQHCEIGICPVDYSGEKEWCVEKHWFGRGRRKCCVLASTAATSLTGQIQSVVTSSASSWVHVTTAGGLTLTTSGAALTAGVCEITLTYETTAN